MNSSGFLLDSDCVIHCLKGNTHAIQRVRQAEVSGISLSILSYAELWEGVFHARDRRSSTSDLEEFITHVRVIPVTDAVCRRFGEIRGTLRKSKTLIGDF